MNESLAEPPKTKPKRDEKLRILVRGTNRKYYLTPPTPKLGRPDYYVRFEVPRDVRARSVRKLPKTVFRSTGTNILAAARLRARDIIESVLEARWEDAEKLKLRSLGATLGQILDRYKPPSRSVNPLAAKRNRNALEMIWREATGRDNVRDDRADSVLTGAVLRTWMQLRLAKAGDDYALQERAAITINSTLAQARSVLSPKVRELYHDLQLPDLTDFRSVRRLEVKVDVSYKPLPQVCIDAIERDALLLKRGESPIAAAAGIEPAEQKQVYRAYLLMSRLGQRNSEVYAAREHWIERHQDGAAEFVIERRAYFVPKNKRGRRLDIDAGLLAELDANRGLPDAWIISAPTPTERYNICHRLINKWLRPLMPPGREKCAYELRKHAASIIVSRPESEGGGIVAAAAFLGDTIATTEEHYGTYLRKVRGIRSDEISSGRAAA